MQLEEPSQLVQEREDEIDIDYSDLPAKRKELSIGQYEVVNNEYHDQIQNKQVALDKMAPNMKAIHRFDDVMERFKAINEDFEKARKNAKDSAEKFGVVKTKRYELFTKAFEKILQSVDNVYGKLTQRRTRTDGQVVHGTAYLTMENPDEPYNGGIKYYAMPPTQRFVEIEALSGGEKTIAALSLLFAFHSFKRAPFFVLDEIDAALDGNNAKAVARFIEKKSKDMQFVVISLKPTTFSHADALIGVCNNRETASSKTFTVNLAHPRWEAAVARPEEEEEVAPMEEDE